MVTKLSISGDIWVLSGLITHKISNKAIFGDFWKLSNMGKMKSNKKINFFHVQRIQITNLSALKHYFC
jgi:hypothetical protein